MKIRWDSPKGALIIAAGSVVFLAIGLFGIVTAITSSGVNLPDEGNLVSILEDANPIPNSGPQAPNAPPIPQGPPPVRMLIPRLYIDAPVVTLGLTQAQLPDVPERPDQVAWYDFSASPGRTSNAVFSGHVDWQTRAGQPIPGVFYRLRELRIGDEIDISLEDGTQFRYRVIGNVATAFDDPNVVKAMNSTTKDVITLITCGGSWFNDRRQPNGGNYTHRVIVRAERVQAAAFQPGVGADYFGF